MKRDETKQFIDENIVENSGGAISAYKLNQVLTKMVDNGAGIDEISPNETCLIHLTASGISDWSSQVVVVNNQSTGEVQSVALNADGTCQFVIANGQSYKVTLPTIGGFITPAVLEFVAVTAQREVNYEYQSETRTELVRIITMDALQLTQLSILDGETITIYDTDGGSYTGEFEGSTCDVRIPYGKTYTVTPLTASGYRATTNPVTNTAGQVQRSILLYYQNEEYGLFGVDENGNLYTIEEIEDLADKTIIKYGFYNDADLANSTRVADGTGNGFYWKIGAESLGSMQWAIGNDEFDTIRLPFYSNLSSWKYAGRYMTDTIIEIGLEKYPTSSNPTPAAIACANRSETFGGKEHRGILLAYDQIHKIATDNKTLFQALYTALGRTAPTIWSGTWWTSCQNNASNAVDLLLGGFSHGGKTISTTVFCAYDL